MKLAVTAYNRFRLLIAFLILMGLWFSACVPHCFAQSSARQVEKTVQQVPPAQPLASQQSSIASQPANPVPANAQNGQNNRTPANDLAANVGFSAPMQGIQEVVIRPIKIGNSNTAELCGIIGQDVTGGLVSVLNKAGVPAISMVDAQSGTMGLSRIELVPESISVNSQGVECTTWISISAEKRGMVSVPSMKGMRNVTVTFWRGNTMITSPEMGHWRAVSDGFERMSLQFAKQYKIDQPPALKLDDK